MMRLATPTSAWMTSFVDLIGLLLTFFIVILAHSNMQPILVPAIEHAHIHNPHSLATNQAGVLRGGETIAQRDERSHRLLLAKLERLERAGEDLLDVVSAGEWIIVESEFGPAESPGRLHWLQRLFDLVDDGGREFHIFVSDVDQFANIIQAQLQPQGILISIREDIALRENQWRVVLR